ncbi:MAG: hypothetical protein WCJ35_23585 [Planctomycetota bacterium]
MQDYQRIADDVHSALFNNGQDGEDVLQAIASEYGLAIDEVNERLRQCGAFLRKGLRSEAIQLCDVEPNLLDVVQIVDFPERPSWNELLRLHGLASPGELRLDVAADLNEAYALEQPLAALLQRHRLLAMSRGSIKLRLDTLRKLATADPDNPIWAKDVLVFEDERLKELQWEVPKAISAGDTNVISALAAELESGKWLIRQPAALIRQISAAQSNVTSRDGLAEMQRVGDLLYDAFTAFDVDTGRTLREHWDLLHTLWGEFADPAMIEHVAPALDWLREQDELAEQETRHQAAVAALTKAIMEHEPFTKVSKLYRVAKRDGELPQTAEKRYTDYLDALQRSARRRTRLVVLAATVAVTAIVAIVTFVAISIRHAGQAERAVQTLTQKIEQDGDSEARRYLDELAAESPRIAEDPRIQELGKQMKKRRINEERRCRAFAAALDLAKKSFADRYPDRELLTKARSLATSDQERHAVDELEHKINERVKGEHAEVDREFLVTVNELKGRIDSLEIAANADNRDASIRKLDDIQKELTAKEDSGPEYGPAVKKQGKFLRDRIKTLDEEFRDPSRQAGQDDLITTACEDTAIFSERLEQYIRSHPNDPRSISFREVVKEAPLWNWVGRWNELVQAMGRNNIRGKSRAAVAEDAAKLRKFLADHPGHPDADAFRQRLPYLDAVVQRSDGEGNPIEAVLRPSFTHPMVAGAWMLADTAGQKYYLLVNPGGCPVYC